MCVKLVGNLSGMQDGVPFPVINSIFKNYTFTMFSVPTEWTLGQVRMCVSPSVAWTVSDPGRGDTQKEAEAGRGWRTPAGRGGSRDNRDRCGPAGGRCQVPAA